MAINEEISNGECTGCKFIRLIADDDLLLSKCVRFPPTVFIDAEGDLAQAFPDTHYRCGEYQKAE